MFQGHFYYHAQLPCIDCYDIIVYYAIHVENPAACFVSNPKSLCLP